MRANFAAFFEDVNALGGKLGLCAGSVVLLDELGEVQRARKAGRPRANDEDIPFELFPLDAHGSFQY